MYFVHFKDRHKHIFATYMHILFTKSCVFFNMYILIQKSRVFFNICIFNHKKSCVLSKCGFHALCLDKDIDFTKYII